MTKIFPFALLLLTSCDSKETDSGILCSNNIVFSVNVKVYDDGGQMIEDAAITYSVDNGPEKACESDGAGGYNCGEDEAGTVAVYVSVDGYEDAEQAVYVEAGVCHVTTETMAFNLVALN